MTRVITASNQLQPLQLPLLGPNCGNWVNSGNRDNSNWGQLTKARNWITATGWQLGKCGNCANSNCQFFYFTITQLTPTGLTKSCLNAKDHKLVRLYFTDFSMLAGACSRPTKRGRRRESQAPRLRIRLGASGRAPTKPKRPKLWPQLRPKPRPVPRPPPHIPSSPPTHPELRPELCS